MIFAYQHSISFIIEILIANRFKFFFVISVIEKPKKPAFRIVKRNNELFVDEVPEFLTVIVNNNKQQKKEAENKPEQELEVGLPPQPKEYLKYPEYDWL